MVKPALQTLAWLVQWLKEGEWRGTVVASVGERTVVIETATNAIEAPH
jgi:hypothetical protein